DDDPRPPADLLLEDLPAVGARLRFAREVIAPAAHAFPAGQAERLDHELEIRVVHELLEAREIVERPELREPGNLMLPHQGPREFLVRFELRGFSRRADRRNRSGLKAIRYPFLERRLQPTHR